MVSYGQILIFVFFLEKLDFKLFNKIVLLVNGNEMTVVHLSLILAPDVTLRVTDFYQLIQISINFFCFFS